MAFCSKCGAQLAAGSGFCGACGAAVAGQSVASAPAPAAGAAATPAPAQPAAAAAPMTNNVAGMLCYILGIVTGIAFLVLEPYNKNRFVRFHAFQAIFFWIACFAFYVVWKFVFLSLLFTPGLGLWGLLGLIWLVIELAMIAAWIFLMIKAYGNEEFKLPVIGDLAAKQAGS